MLSFWTTGASAGTWMLSSLTGLTLKSVGGLEASTTSGLVLVRSTGGLILASSAWSILVPAGSLSPGPFGISTGPVFGFSWITGLWTTSASGGFAGRTGSLGSTFDIGGL